MKKATILISCMGLILTAGCAKQPQEPKLTYANIAFQDWVGYGPFYLASEKGFFKEEGVALQFVDEQLDSARRDAFKQGMLDFEAGTVDLLVSKAAQDTPIVAVMKIDSSFGSDGIVASDKIIKLEDLEGKTVALARDDVGEAFLSVLFYRNGLSLKDVVYVAQPPGGVAQAFLDGKADACVTWEPQLSEALRKPGAHLLTSSREHPDVIIDTLNVRRDLVEHQPVLVKKIMRGWFKGLKYYREHPEEASQVIAPHYKVTPEQYRKQVEGLLWEPYERQLSSAEGKEWSDAFNAIAAIKLANNRISQKPAASNFIDRTLLEKLYEDSR